MLAHIAQTTENGPALVIAPPAVVGNWASEAKKFVPGVKVMVHHGPNRAEGRMIERAVRKADLVITTSPYVAPLVDSGAAVALAVAHHERIPLLPGVPTMQEIGVASIPRGSWAGLFVPAGTSDEDVQQAFEAVEYAMSDPDAVRRISELGMVVSLSESPAAFADFITAEGQRLKSAVERYEIGIE